MTNESRGKPMTLYERLEDAAIRLAIKIYATKQLKPWTEELLDIRSEYIVSYPSLSEYEKTNLTRLLGEVDQMIVGTTHINNLARRLR